MLHSPLKYSIYDTIYSLCPNQTKYSAKCAKTIHQRSSTKADSTSARLAVLISIERVLYMWTTIAEAVGLGLVLGTLMILFGLAPELDILLIEAYGRL